MKNTLLLISTLLSTVVAVVGAGCSQQAPNCQVSNSLAYAAKFAQTAGGTDAPCGGLKGDQIGFGSYNPLNKDGNAPDLSKASLAIRTDRLGELVANAVANDLGDGTEGDQPFALGDFKQAFPTNDICEPKEMSPAHQVLPDIPGDDGDTPDDTSDDIPPQAGTDFQETWTGVQVFVTAAAEGTQVKGHYAIAVDGCQAEYDVLALFPAVDCTGADADGNAVADPDLCSPVAIPEKGLSTGSGISPDVSTQCENIGGADSPQFFCLLDADPTTATLPVPKKK